MSNARGVPRAERIRAALTAEGKQGLELSTAEIKRAVRKWYPEVPESSILPADFCRNHKNKDPFSGKYPLFDKVGPDKYVFLGEVGVKASMESLAELISTRNEIDKEIAALIKRPASTGHIGEFIASCIFGIDLELTANKKGIDGHFAVEPLAGRTVNIKFYTKNYSTLDVNPAAIPDYYLVLAGPRTPAESSKGKHSPLIIASVHIFEGKSLKNVLANVQVGIATSVRKSLWEESEIYPRPHSQIVPVTQRQRAMLDLFSAQ